MPVPLETWEQLSMEQWTCAPCNAVNFGIRKKCRFCKQLRPELAALEGEQARAALNETSALDTPGEGEG